MNAEYFVNYKVMSLREKCQDYRKSIRKEEINEIFNKRRREMLNFPGLTAQSQSNIAKLFSDFPETFTLQHLEELAKFSATEQGAETIKKAQIIDRLSLLFNRANVLTDPEKLFSVSVIICNYFYLSHEQPPNDTFIAEVVAIAREGQTNTKNNCLGILRHILQGFPKEKEQIVHRHGLLDLINQTFNSSPALTTVRQILEVTYFVLKNANKLDAYKKLNKYFYQVIVSNNDYILFCLSLECIRVQLGMFSHEMQKQMKEGHIMEKILRFSYTVKEAKMLYRCLECANLCIRSLGSANFNHVLQIICLLQTGTEIRNIGTYNLATLKELGYRVIYQFLILKENDGIEQVCNFQSGEFLKRLLMELQQSDNPSIVLELTYLITVVLMNRKPNGDQHKIIASVKRAELLLSGNPDFQGYLQMFYATC